MDSAKLNDWMQVIGIFALVVSLVFVGLQMKQAQDIALSNAYQARATTIIEMVTANAANEQGLAAWHAPDSAAIDGLSPEQVRAGNQMALGLLLAYDNMFFQYESGFISSHGWATGRVDMKNGMKLLFVRRYFESQTDRMRPSFKAVFVDIINELDTDQVVEPIVDFNYLSVSDGRIQTLHDIEYEIAVADGFELTQPKNRVDNFDGTPYKISLAAFISDDSALMIHAETVADLSGASDYSNLPHAEWPDKSFRSGGHICLQVPEEALEGEHDLLWLRDNGFDPVGTLLFGQYFATTTDMNTEIVLSILLKLSSCDDEAANAEVISEFQARIAVTKVE